MSENVVVKYDGAVLKTTKVKKILGIVLDSYLTFKEHIKEKKAGFKALRGLENVIVGNKSYS